VKFSRTVEAIKVFGEIYISVVEVSPQSELMIPTLANLGPVERKKTTTDFSFVRGVSYPRPGDL
jgi:hypothetical protein